MTIRVPFNDLYLHHQSIRSELDHAINTVIRESAFIRGPHVEEFEQQFSVLMKRKHTVSCSNGTTALYIAMRALDVKRGDEVIVPGMSWISTSETVTQAGGNVRFCDISSDTHVMDPASLEAAITERTVGIIPVHLYGHPAPMPEIMDIAKRHNLWVIEDCAQAHLATVVGKQVGTFGNAATFSFYPGKNLGAMGDAGAIISNDEALCEKMAMFARHGGLRKGDHQIEGINSRLDGLQAAILNVKLVHLKRWTEARRRVARAYLAHLPDGGAMSLPQIADGCEPVWHLFVIQVEDRSGLKEYLSKTGIQTSVNYPRALPFLPCYGHLAYRPHDFPNSFSLQEACLSLPIYPEITDDQVKTVYEAVASWHA